MPSSIRRHHWSSASILRASILDIAQQSEPYRNIGKIHVLYSFNFIEMASRELYFTLTATSNIISLLRVHAGKQSTRAVIVV